MFVDGCIKKLINVRYVLDLKLNLISIGALDACVCCVKIKNGVIKVMIGSMDFMNGHLKNGLYVLDGFKCCMK